MPLNTAVQDTDKKLEAFGNAILGEAIEESRRITDELHKRQEEIISGAKAEISADAERYVNVRISEIQAREGRRVAARMTENKHTLLQYREDCATESFAKVSARIEAFTASEDYLPHLKTLLRQAVEALGYGFSATVYLRPEDMRFADELMNSASGVSLAFAEGSFALGGLSLVCLSKGRRVDMTFDSALSDMVGHFSELAGLNIGN